MDLLPLSANHDTVGEDKTITDGTELVKLIGATLTQVGVLEDAFVQ